MKAFSTKTAAVIVTALLVTTAFQFWLIQFSALHSSESSDVASLLNHLAEIASRLDAIEARVFKDVGEPRTPVAPVQKSTVDLSFLGEAKPASVSVPTTSQTTAKEQLPSNAAAPSLPLSTTDAECAAAAAAALKERLGYTKAYLGDLQSVPMEHRWRYVSDELYWRKTDDLFCKFVKYNKTLTMPPPSIQRRINEVCEELTRMGREKLCAMFRLSFANTLTTATRMLADGTAYVITGDIPLMWLRDSSAQMHAYVSFAPQDPYLQIIIEGTIRRQIQFIKLDPYGSSFRLKLDFDDVGKQLMTDWDFRSGRTVHVAMHNYEPDSLCYFVMLSYNYWKATGIRAIFEEEWLNAAKLILDVFEIEQRHPEKSNYTYPELDGGQGSKVCYSGMTWSGFRPSDDKCVYHYLVPTNMFAVVTCQRIAELATEMYRDTAVAKRATELAASIDDGIHRHGVVDNPTYGKIYAYEVDGCGNVLLMDDANIPSLLSAPYLGYSSPHDPTNVIYQNTRKFILSKGNPWFFEGSVARGIGSPHTGGGSVWHLSLIMQALTGPDSEVLEMIDMLQRTDAGTNLMHESFNPSFPTSFTRRWFGWANSLFGEMLLKKMDFLRSQRPS